MKWEMELEKKQRVQEEEIYNAIKKEIKEEPMDDAYG